MTEQERDALLLELRERLARVDGKVDALGELPEAVDRIENQVLDLRATCTRPASTSPRIIPPKQPAEGDRSPSTYWSSSPLIFQGRPISN